MGRFRSAYSGYRGRKTLNEILKWIAALLGVLVLLVLLGLMLGQDYIVFTDRGPRLELPFFRPAEGTSELDGNVNVVVEQDGQGGTNSAAPVMAALELPVEAVLSGEVTELLAQAEANALILEMKSPQGTLGWVAQSSLAARAEVNAQTQGINSALLEWNQGEVYTIARVTCFRDNTMPYNFNDMALRASYGNWRDELGLRWLNPDSQTARDYLIGLCAELAELGFDEILLDCYGFPYEGNLESIVQGASYQTGAFTQTVEEFLDEIRQEIQPHETVLSLRVDRAMLGGETALGGVTAAGLERLADRIWMLGDGAQPALPDLLAEAGISKGGERLVILGAALDAQGEISRAVLEES